MRDQQSQTPLAACYINAATPGILSLQLRGRGLPEVNEILTLERYSSELFAWSHGSTYWLFTRGAANFCLARLMQIATDALRADAQPVVAS